jgi:hypothetical protein
LLRPNFYSLAYYHRWLAFEIVFFSFHKRGIQAGYSAVIFNRCASAKPQRRPQHSGKAPFSENVGVSSPAVNELRLPVVLRILLVILMQMRSGSCLSFDADPDPT